MEREQVGFWIGVPTMYWALLQYVTGSGADPAPVARNLRLCVSGGAPMPHEVMRRFEETFGVRVLEGLRPVRNVARGGLQPAQRPSKPGTVGLPVFGVDVRCVDERDLPVAPASAARSSSAGRT